MATNQTHKLVHYVIHAGPKHLGATRLNKVLWFADVVAFRRYGKSLTGATSYRRMPHGPVPNGIDFILSNLKECGAIVEERTMTPVGSRREFSSREIPDVEAFSARDIALVHEILAFVIRQSAESVSELSHDSLWEEVAMGEQMSVEAGSVFPDDVTEQDCDELDRAPSYA